MSAEKKSSSLWGTLKRSVGMKSKKGKAAASTEEEELWQCSACTLKNSHTSSACAACLTPRVRDSHITRDITSSKSRDNVGTASADNGGSNDFMASVPEDSFATLPDESFTANTFAIPDDNAFASSSVMFDDDGSSPSFTTGQASSDHNGNKEKLSFFDFDSESSQFKSDGFQPSTAFGASIHVDKEGSSTDISSSNCSIISEYIDQPADESYSKTEKEEIEPDTARSVVNMTDVSAITTELDSSMMKNNGPSTARKAPGRVGGSSNSMSAAGIGGEIPARRRELPVTAASTEVSLATVASLPTNQTMSNTVPVSFYDPQHETHIIPSNIDTNLPADGVGGMFTPTPKHRPTNVLESEKDTFFQSTSGVNESLILPSVSRSQYVLSSPEDADKSNGHAGPGGGGGLRLGQPVMAGLSPTERAQDDENRRHHSKKWGGHDAGARIASVLDNLGSPKTLPVNGPGPSYRELQALLLLNDQLNDALQQQEQLRLTESHDYLYAMRNLQNDLQEAVEQREKAVQDANSMKNTVDTITELQEKLHKQCENTVIAEDRVRKLTEYITELETSNKVSGNKPENVDDDMTVSTPVVVSQLSNGLKQQIQQSLSQLMVAENRITEISNEMEVVNGLYHELQAREKEQSIIIEKEKEQILEHKFAYENLLIDKIALEQYLEDRILEITRLQQVAKESHDDHMHERKQLTVALTKAEGERNTLKAAADQLMHTGQLNEQTITLLTETKSELIAKLKQRDEEILHNQGINEKLELNRNRALHAETELASCKIQLSSYECENNNLLNSLKSLEDKYNIHQEKTNKMNQELILEKENNEIKYKNQFNTLANELNLNETLLKTANMKIIALEKGAEESAASSSETASTLASTRKRLESELKGAYDEIKELKAMHTKTQRELRELNDKNQFLEYDHSNTVADLEASKEICKEFSIKYNKKVEELQSLSSIVADNQSTISNLERIIADSNDENDKLNQKLQIDTTTLQNSLTTLQRRYHTLKEEDQSLKVINTSVKEDNSRLINEVQVLNDKLEITHNTQIDMDKQLNHVKKRLEDALSDRKNSDLLLSGAQKTSNELHEKSLKLSASLATLELLREKEKVSKEHLEKSKSKNDLLENRLASAQSKLDSTSKRLSATEAECHQLSLRLVTAQEETQDAQSTLLSEQRKMDQNIRDANTKADLNVRLLQSHRNELIACNEKMKNMIAKTDMIDQIQSIEESYVNQIHEWQNKYENIVQELKDEHERASERCIDLIEIQKALVVIPSTITRNENWNTVEIKLIKNIRKTVEDIHKKMCTVLDSFECKKFDGDEEDQIEMTHRLNTEKKLIKVKKDRIDSFDIIINDIITNKEILYEYEVGRNKRLQKSTEITETMYSDIDQLRNDLEYTTDQVISLNIDKENLIEKNKDIMIELNSLKQDIMNQDQKYRENVETMVLSEQNYQLNFKKALSDEVEKATLSYKETASKMQDSYHVLQHKLEISHAEYIAMEEVTKRQTEEIEMLRRDICNAVDQHNVIQSNLVDRERSNDIILAQLETAQLKASQEARKRHDIERTLRRVNTGYSQLSSLSASEEKGR
jgi:hypothetical protein